jgi:hypothetical protein
LADQRDRRKNGYRAPRSKSTEDETRRSWLRRLRLLGLTEGEYLDLLSKQDGRCAICKTDEPWGRSRTWHVDHDHESGRVRGLLCSKCNRGIGYFQDDVNRLAAAIVYLNASHSQTTAATFSSK